MQTVSPLRPAQRTHADGSVCLEGTRKLPLNFSACCKQFETHTVACVHDVRYEWTAASGWRIAIADFAGGGGLAIRHCPHCGANLARLKQSA